MRLAADAEVLLSAVVGGRAKDVLQHPENVVDHSEYAAKVTEARRRIGRRDPDDVELLALALHADLAVWSNDNDFEDAGIQWYTTAELLRRLQQRT